MNRLHRRRLMETVLSYLSRYRARPATIVICHEDGGDYHFECPACGTLNINGEVMATICPAVD